MANLRMTISLPEDLAVRFVRTVPANRRSHYIAELLEEELGDPEQMLRDACDALPWDSRFARRARALLLLQTP